MLEKNREILIRVLHYIEVYIRKTSNNRFPLSDISYIVKKINKIVQSNTLYERDIKKLIIFLQKNLEIEEEVDYHGEALVDYLYELSNF